MPDFAALMKMATEAAELVSKVSSAYADIRDTLSETEQTQLNDKLRTIHASNMALSAELDAALRDAEKK